MLIRSFTLSSALVFASAAAFFPALAQAAAPVISSINPSTVYAGPFFVTVSGSGFASGATATLGGAALQVAYVSSTELIVEGTASAGKTSLNVSVSGSTSAAFPVSVTAAQASPYVAARFLEQASFGPTAQTIAQVQQLGIPGYLAQQFSAAVTPIAAANANAQNLNLVQANYLYNAMNGQDQLRQRVAFALSEIWVISGMSITPTVVSEAFVPYLKILQSDAFGNYFQLMQDITLNPGMGAFLNLVYNMKGNAAQGTEPNQNYAREVMQLFTVGTSMLNIDGTPQLDAQGNLISTYTQAQVADTARAFTGWFYAPLNGGTPLPTDPQNFALPLVSIANEHDTGSKTIIGGTVIPANQTPAQDMLSVLTTLFNHQNIGPFVCKQLIQHLVTSNPSSAYVQRIATIFNNDGTGTRGNLRAVVQAILTDTEARGGDYPNTASATFGHLSEPVLYVTRLLRELGAALPASNTLYTATSWIGQQLFYPASVFSYFSPSFPLPGQPTLLGPEYQINTGSYVMNRANYAEEVTFGTNPGYGVTENLSMYVNLASNPGMLLDYINLTLMHGQLSSGARQALLTAVTTTTAGQTWKAYNALYLAATSAEYQVLH